MAELPRKDGHGAMMTEALAQAQVEIARGGARGIALANDDDGDAADRGAT